MTYPRTSDVDVLLARARPRTLEIYRYWDAKRGNRRMPARADIDPLEMKSWLVGIQLIDVLQNPRRLLYRLVGQADVDFRGYNPTGKSVEECAIGRTLEEALENYEIVITNRTFVFDFAQFRNSAGLLKNQECILLPLSDDDDLVNMIMTYGEVEPVT